MDEEKKLKSISTFDKNQNLKYLITFHYDTDSLGNELVIEHQIEIKKKRITKVISTKNKYGDLISKIHMDEKGALKAEAYYEYIYDDINNWVERKSKWRIKTDQEYLTHIITREISYY